MVSFSNLILWNFDTKCTHLHPDQNPSMLLFNALGSPPFRSIKLREKKATCSACSNSGDNLVSIANTDYVHFCGGPIPDWVNEGRVPGDTGHRVQAQVAVFFAFSTMINKDSTGSSRSHLLEKTSEDNRCAIKNRIWHLSTSWFRKWEESH